MDLSLFLVLQGNAEIKNFLKGFGEVILTHREMNFYRVRIGGEEVRTTLREPSLQVLGDILGQGVELSSTIPSLSESVRSILASRDARVFSPSVLGTVKMLHNVNRDIRFLGRHLVECYD